MMLIKHHAVFIKLADDNMMGGFQKLKQLVGFDRQRSGATLQKNDLGFVHSVPSPTHLTSRLTPQGPKSITLDFKLPYAQLYPAINAAFAGSTLDPKQVVMRPGCHASPAPT